MWHGKEPGLNGFDDGPLMNSGEGEREPEKLLIAANPDLLVFR